MSTYPLAKPKTAVTSVVDVIIQPEAGAGTPDAFLFRVKPSQVTLNFSVQSADVTGAADTNAVFTHNMMTRGQFQIQGYAIGDAALKLSNLQSEKNGAAHNDALIAGGTASHPAGGSGNYNIRFNYSSGRYLYGTALISSIQLSYSRSCPFVGVAITGVLTKTDLGHASNVDV